MVFIDQTEKQRHPLRRRGFNIAVATPIMLVPILTIASARLAPLALGLAIVSIAISAIARGESLWSRSFPVQAGLGAFIFIAYAAASAAWAPLRLPPVQVASEALCLVLIAMAGVSLIEGEARQGAIHAGEGLWLGLLIVTLVYAVDAALAQRLKITLYNALNLQPGDLTPARYYYWKNGKLDRIIASDTTRNAFPITLLFWSALLALRGTIQRPMLKVVGLALAIIVTFAVSVSSHETSWLALGVSAAVFLLGLVSPRAARMTVLVGWVVVCLAAPLLARGLHAAGMATAPWLPASARSRIVIWNTTAELAAEAPVLGRGAHMTYYLTDKLSPPPPPDAAKTLRDFFRDPKKVRPPTLSTHAHNIYLQTWFELGAVGALLLSGVGIALLLAIGRLSTVIQPYALATFASGATLAGSSYGMWQSWLMAMFAIAVVMFAIARRAFETRPAD